MAIVRQERIKTHEAFIWSVADLLRGDYKQSEYGRVILPLTVLRRLDCVLEPTKAKVLETADRLEGKVQNVEPVLCQASGEQFFNTSPLDLRRVLADPVTVADNLKAYIAGFSESARDIIEHFRFGTHIDRLDRANLLYKVLGRFVDIDLHPGVVSNIEMGYLYENLIRRFSELSNETAGEHFTPREVIRLMVNLLFAEDGEALSKPGVKRTLFDPACGTGGMLSVAEDHLRSLNPSARLEAYGQELNGETYATCRADMMLKGQDASHIIFGNSFSEDGFEGDTFDYLLANPPFGVEWKKVEKPIRDEHFSRGFAGRFGAGLPPIDDGAILFLQHMLSKMKPADQGGSRVAIVFNGSPLSNEDPFGKPTKQRTGNLCEIRRWIIENDWLDAIVALPDQLFYNTGIATYFWIVTNRKTPERRGKVQLIDARELWTKMPKSLGNKRKQIADDQITEITRLYADFAEGDRVRIFPNEAFGFLRITVERPLRVHWEINDDTLAAVEVARAVQTLDEPDRQKLVAQLRQHHGTRYDYGTGDLDDVLADAIGHLSGSTRAVDKAVRDGLTVRDPSDPIVTKRKGRVEPDPELRDQEDVPLPPTPVVYEADVSGRLDTPEYRQAVDNYMDAEVLPYLGDAWVDHGKTKIGYEVPLVRHFYRYMPPRPLVEIDAEIKQLEAEVQDLLREVTE